MKRRIVLPMLILSVCVAAATLTARAEDSIAASKSLKEIVVKGERRVVRGDTLVIYPSRSQRKNNFTGYELLRSMLLPGLRVDAVNGNITVNGDQSAVLLINGRPVGKQDILTLHPRDIARIEFLQDPTAEYAYDTNIGAVINLVTKERHNGYQAALLANNAVTTAYGDNTAYGKLFHKNSELGISVNSEYSSLSRRRIDNFDKYLVGDDWHSITRKGINTPLRYTSNAIQISYNTLVPNKYIFDITAKGTFYHSPDRNHLQYVTEDGRTPYYQLTKPYEKYLSPSLNIYYKHFFNKKSAISANLVGVYRNTDYSYKLEESTVADMATAIPTYGYDSKGNRQSYIGEVKYYNMFKPKLGLTTGMRVSYSYTSNRYTGDKPGREHLHESNMYIYAAAYGYLLKSRLYYYVGAGTSGRMISHDGIHTSKWLVRPEIMVNYRLKKWTFALSGGIAQNTPSTSQLVATELRTNSLEVLQGNPDLKDWWNYWSWLRINGRIGPVGIQNKLSFNRAQDPVMSYIYMRDNNGTPVFVTSYDNQKSMTIISDDLNIYAGLSENLQISVGTTFRSYQSRGNTYSHNLDTWRINANLDWSHKNISAGIGWRSKEKSLTSETITATGASNNIYINYTIGDFMRVGLMGQHLFCKNGPVFREQLDNQYMSKNEKLVVPAHGNMVLLTVAISISGGKQRKSIDIDLTNDDTESGILKNE